VRNIRVTHLLCFSSRVRAASLNVAYNTIGDIQVMQLYALESRANAPLECRTQYSTKKKKKKARVSGSHKTHRHHARDKQVRVRPSKRSKARVALSNQRAVPKNGLLKIAPPG
jgi:hypothetical protein